MPAEQFDWLLAELDSAPRRAPALEEAARRPRGFTRA